MDIYLKVLILLPVITVYALIVFKVFQKLFTPYTIINFSRLHWYGV
jgi:hypothetical protein